MSACPECGSWERKVKESRKDTRYGWKWRLSDCLNCGHRWDSYECPAAGMTVDGEGNPEGRLER